MNTSDFSLLTRMRLQSLVPVCSEVRSAINAVEKMDKGTSKCLIKTLLKCDKTKCLLSSSREARSLSPPSSPPLSPSLARPSFVTATALPPNTSVRGLKRAMQVPAMMANREIGRFRHHGSFSFGSKCLMMDKFLPNRGKQLARFGQKIFCGKFSTCGDMFMSACQGMTETSPVCV